MSIFDRKDLLNSKKLIDQIILEPNSETNSANLVKINENNNPSINGTLFGLKKLQKVHQNVQPFDIKKTPSQKTRYEHKTLKPTVSQPEQITRGWRMPIQIQPNSTNININQPKFKVSKRKNSRITAFKSKSKAEMVKGVINSRPKFFLGKGNNHLLVAKIFISRGWEETNSVQDAKLIWLQDNKRLIYPQLTKARIMVNLFEKHYELSNKNYLYKNIRQYCQFQSQNNKTSQSQITVTSDKIHSSSVSSRLDYKNILPTTFLLDFKKPQASIRQQLQEFLQYYIKNHPKGKNLKLKGSFNLIQCGKQYKIRYKDIISEIGLISYGSNAKGSTIDIEEKKKEIVDNVIIEQKKKLDVQELDLTNINKQKQEDKQKYIWILKPADLNRGRGIKLFSKLKTLEQLLTEDQFQSNFKMYFNPEQNNSIPNCFILQRYIQHPLLLSTRKFDIRMWAILTPNNKVYLCKEGYLRLSSVPYCLNKQGLKNPFIHLTNNAIQKNSEKYGEKQEGNQWSFLQFKQYLQKYQQKINLQKILEKVHQIVRLTFQATLHKIVGKNLKKSNNCFQIFGYDFLIDKDGNVWLLEVNSNPCLEESSSVLKRLLPNLLNEVIDMIWGDQFVIKQSQGSKEQKLLQQILIGEIKQGKSQIKADKQGDKKLQQHNNE